MFDLCFELLRIPVENLHTLLDADFDRNDENTLRLRDLYVGDIEKLWELLPNSEADTDLLDQLISDSGNAILSFSTPGNFASSLCEVKDQDISGIVAQWSTSRSFKNWSIADLEKLVQKLRSFARSAAKNDEIIIYMQDL